MSAETTVKGEISQKLNLEMYVEWTIGDIFCETVVDTSYQSPRFSIPGSEWYLSINPNGQTENDSLGWISLYLMRAGDDSIPPITVNYNLGVKKVDGTIEIKTLNDSKVFAKKDAGWGIAPFLQRSELSERKYELAPSGALTVTCTVEVKDAEDSTSSLIELSENFKNMFLSAKGCDATFKVQSQEFPIHRSVLASRCPVFESMFEVDMKEKSSGTVDVVDCDPEAFKDFLVYMYSGRFQVSSRNGLELYKIAHKYCIETLKSACVCLILSNLSVDTVVDVAIVGDQFDENELKVKSQDFFNEKYEEVFSTKAWIALLGQKPSLANQLLISMAKNTKMKKIPS